MKICDIVQFYSPISGGVKRYIHDKIRFLADEPALSHLIIVPSDRNAVHWERCSRIYEIRSPRLPGSESYRMLIARQSILQIMDAERPQIIEVGDPYRSAWIGLEASRRLRIPVVSFYHSDYPRALQRTLRRYGGIPAQQLFARAIEWYLRRLYNRMDATVVPSSSADENLRAMEIDRRVRIPLGTDTEVFQPRSSRAKVLRELGLQLETRLLVYAGRLAREKNIRALLGMMEHIPCAYGPLHLLLIGDGELGRHIQTQAGRREDITWRPYCDDPGRLAEYYSAADLFVHAGTAETFGLVSIEAQACGTRVVGVKGGGLEDTLVGEVPVILAEDATAASLARAVGSALHLGETADHRNRRRQRILAAFTWTETYRKLVALYAHLCARKPVESLVLPSPAPGAALQRTPTLASAP
jgi:alpha-1,6-mannosyltransferase